MRTWVGGCWPATARGLVGRTAIATSGSAAMLKADHVSVFAVPRTRGTGSHIATPDIDCGSGSRRSMQEGAGRQLRARPRTCHSLVRPPANGPASARIPAAPSRSRSSRHRRRDHHRLRIRANEKPAACGVRRIVERLEASMRALCALLSRGRDTTCRPREGARATTRYS